ncbi:hypothetical protein L249_1219 [Ophiocordyceps polyrhachis-furcata BCC 54312]|uniref:diphosphomevalonate decarboxylase n=1 Tax=Ophiocordyceps polyrhachis-furcata BCC 54312 TaxID=1330021 RepID=A0A367LDS8_9HYPO|nr:hypothetical protein L249_1219 [Ophiocordyceps polyrhachis-furcata BCC 54312]
MASATAIIYRASTTAPVNIAVVKLRRYWGKRDTELNLPTNSSLSVTLSQADLRTLTTASCSDSFRHGDSLTLNGEPADVSGARTQACFRELRARRARLEAADPSLPRMSTMALRIVSENNFPTAAGLASSAAGFAALVRAVADLYRLPDSPERLSVVARQGSGSACRSLMGGYVAWRAGERHDGLDSVADVVAPASHWPEMRALILVVSAAKKDVSSTSGMQRTVESSGLFSQRVSSVVPANMMAMEQAIKARDFAAFAKVTMAESNSFHACCLDTYPPIFYLNDVSRAAIGAVEAINAAAETTVAAYTFDAGPNCVVYYLQGDASTVLGAFSPVLDGVAGWKKDCHPTASSARLDEGIAQALKAGVSRVIMTAVGEGPVPSEEHLVAVSPNHQNKNTMPRRFEPSDMNGDDFAHRINAGRDITVVELSKSGHDPRLWTRSDRKGVSSSYLRSSLPPLFLTRPVISPRALGQVTKTQKQVRLRPQDGTTMRSLRKAIFAAFLPVDFPNSVSSDYLAYQTYDSLQAFFSTITSLLANRALLQGLGVGDANSSATFAMLLTISRNAVSNIVTIGFAHRFGLSIEPEAKKYRFLADLFNDSAFFLELYSPHLAPSAKALALCSAEGLRAVCGVAAGASKAALSLHFAQNDNLSELSAKEASQETAVSLIGLFVGSIVVRAVQDQTLVVCLVVVLSLAHLWTNYRGVRSVCMTSINKQRATILYNAYSMFSDVLSPEQVAESESIVFWDDIIRNADREPAMRIEFATNFGHAIRWGVSDVLVVDGPMHSRFIRPYAPGRPGNIKIMLWDGARPEHAILAWFMAMDTARATGAADPYGDAKETIDAKWRPRARDDSLWDGLEAQGWDLDTGAMETGPGVRIGVEVSASKVE